VRREETQAEVESALARIAEHREVIDQAKGIVMLAAGCDAGRVDRGRLVGAVGTLVTSWESAHCG